MLNPSCVRGILLDIEGTTTPIAFVHEVLFPFARSNVKDYLMAQLGSAELAGDLAILSQEHAADVDQSLQPPPLIRGSSDDEIGSMVAYVHWLIDRDRKSTGLKSLQGKIWQQGYREGTLKAPVFADVPPALERWDRAGANISIFSSGSILAQKLLFANSEAGDLTQFIDGYFDRTSGAKTSAESYRQIALALRLAAGEILFISDVIAELNAAAAAGMQTLICIRVGNQPQTDPRPHQAIYSFDEIPGFVIEGKGP